jgi:hypothetical protein
MNTGIGDATNLGWKLAFAARDQGAYDDVLLDSYELERRPVARQIVALTHAVFWAEAATDPVARAIRSAVAATGPRVLPVVLRERRLLAEGVRLLGQLRVNDRASPLSLTAHAPRSWPRGGDRLGDADVATAASAARLHDLTASPGLHLLLQRDATVVTSVRAHAAHSHRLDAPGTAIAVIRPDGYVGFAGDTADHHLLETWLTLASAPRSRSVP